MVALTVRKTVSVKDYIRKYGIDLNGLSSILGVLKQFRSRSSIRQSPSSVMLQILRYGKSFKRVVEHVELDISGFDAKLSSLLSNGKRVRLLKTFYKHKWESPEVNISREDVERILEPLEGLGLGEFRFRTELRYNKKFEEAVKSYVEEGRVSGKVVYDEARKRLIVFSRVVGRFSLGKYYTLFVLEPDDHGRVRTTYFCTCPWARGETVDGRGRRISPEYTSLCKHGIATLFYYFPEIAAYLKLAAEDKLSRVEFDKLVPVVRKAFDEVQKKLNNYISRYPEAEGIVLSNIAYALTRELYKKFHELGNVEKYVFQPLGLGEVMKLWDSITVKTRTVAEESGQPLGEEVVDVEKAVEELKKTGVYDRVRKLERLLNGLQGSRTTTLYTRALLAGIVLGSDLESDPTIVSVVGDPGTGKTLTAEGLARLIGVRSIVVEREVEESTIRDEAVKHLSKYASRFLEFFEKLVESKLPEEKREDARRFFEEYLGKALYVAELSDVKVSVRLAKRFAEVFTSLYGIKEKKLELSIARLFHEVLRVYKEVYRSHMDRKAVEHRALEERRKLLELVSRLGLISKPEDKEELNSGAVRWEIVETARGYKVRVVIDTHYMVKRLGGDVEKIAKAIEKLSQHGKLYMRTEVPGLAELKLSEAEYLEKALRVREEDILSPARRLIWVGGELTKRSLILIDESRRAPELLERLLTDLSSAARDTRRTNLIVTTDNAEPLMEAESDPRLDAFHSRVNFEVVTPSTTVAYVISETLREILDLERSNEIPLLTLDEALLLNIASEGVVFPERYEKVLYAIPLLLIYDFKVLRPETVRALYNAPENEKVMAPPLILPVPKGSVDTGDIVKGDYSEAEWGVSLPAIRMMPERRFGHHVVRASKALAILEEKTMVDEETFLSALEMVLMARVFPVSHQSPYLYVDAKARVVDAILNKVREFLRRETATEKLIETLGSLTLPSEYTLVKALEEMIENPVAAAVFMRFLEQMLVSEHTREFVELAKKIPGLIKTLELIARYEKIRINYVS